MLQIIITLAFRYKSGKIQVSYVDFLYESEGRLNFFCNVNKIQIHIL